MSDPDPNTPPTFTIRLADGAVWDTWRPTPEMWAKLRALAEREGWGLEELTAFITTAYGRID